MGPTESAAISEPEPTEPAEPTESVSTSQPDVATSESSVIDDQDLEADRTLADQAVLTAAGSVR
jgi:hypothetical protein